MKLGTKLLLAAMGALLLSTGVGIVLQRST